MDTPSQKVGSKVALKLQSWVRYGWWEAGIIYSPPEPLVDHPARPYYEAPRHQRCIKHSFPVLLAVIQARDVKFTLPSLLLCILASARRRGHHRSIAIACHVQTFSLQCVWHGQRLCCRECVLVVVPGLGDLCSTGQRLRVPEWVREEESQCCMRLAGTVRETDPEKVGEAVFWGILFCL